MQKIKTEQHSFTGGMKVTAWLFTVSFLQLHSWHCILALIVLPYYLGAALRGSLNP